MQNEFEKIEEARDILISGIAQTMVIYGVTPSVGRIYGVLYFSDKPMSLDQIKDEVAMSKASVSNGLRELLDTEMVIKVWKKGDRKDHYIAEKDFVKNFINFFVKKLRQESSLILKASSQALPTLEDIAKSASSKEAQAIAQRDIDMIHMSNQYFDWTHRLTNALETGEIFRYFPLTTEEDT